MHLRNAIHSQLLSLAALACLTLALEGCSNAQSQTAEASSGPDFFKLSLTVDGQNSKPASPLPETSGLYQVESFNYLCTYNPGVVLLYVIAGPDSGMAFGLPAGGTIQGGGPLKFWLHPTDQLQAINSNNIQSCTLYLFGEIVSGTVQTLQ